MDIGRWNQYKICFVGYCDVFCDLNNRRKITA